MTLIKVYFLITIINFLNIGCNSEVNKNNSFDIKKYSKDTNTANIVSTVMDSIPTFSCKDILQKPNTSDSVFVHIKTMTYNKENLIFITKDSIFYAYNQKGSNCELVFKNSIEYPKSSSPYTYADGSTIELRDIDGDKQNEIFILVYKSTTSSRYVVYRLEDKGLKISLRKIQRLDEVFNPEYDEKTGMIISNRTNRSSEIIEYFKLSKDSILTFVKGVENGKNGEKNYTEKEGW